MAIETKQAVECRQCKKLILEKGYYIILDYRASKKAGDILKTGIGAGDSVIYCDINCLSKHMATVYSQFIDL